MTKSPSRVPKASSWELMAYRVAPPASFLGLSLAASFGVDVNPWLFAISAAAHWKMAVGVLKFPETWVVQVPQFPSTPDQPKQIEDKLD
jgi:hypothetical protein